MITFVLLGVLAAQPSSEKISVSIDVPDAIHAPISKYVTCIDTNVLALSQNAGPVHWQKMQELVDQAQQICVQTRSQAYAKALRLIKHDKSIPAADREGRVAKVFADIDRTNQELVAGVRRIDETQQSKSAK